MNYITTIAVLSKRLGSMHISIQLMELCTRLRPPTCPTGDVGDYLSCEGNSAPSLLLSIRK